MLLFTACGASNGGPSPKESTAIVVPASSTADSTSQSPVPPNTPSANPADSQQPVPPASNSGQNGVAAHSERAAWTLLGAGLNKGRSAASLSMAAPEGVPYVAWEESGQVHVDFWDGKAWQGEEKAFNVDPAQPAFLPTLSTDGSALYLSWTEGAGMKTLYVIQKEAGAWHPVAALAPGFGDRCYAANADLAIRQGVPQLLSDSFCTDTQYAATTFHQWLGKWTEPSGLGAQGHYADTPALRKYAIASDEGGVYAAVVEGVKEEASLHIYRQDGRGWAALGKALNDTMMTASPFALKLIDGTPYAAFQAGDIQVKHWNGSAWVADGPAFVSTVDAPLASPALIGIAGIPYVGYAGAQSAVWFRGDSGWTQMGDPLNRPGTVASSLSLAASSNTLYAAWIEAGGDGAGGSVFVKKVTVQ